MDKILVTRPSQDFERTAQALHAAGFAAVAAPMMNFEIMGFDVPDLSQFSALVFTSANGVRALQQRPEFRGMACYAVGEQSAKAAVDAGFVLLAQGAGDVQSLCKIIEKDNFGRKHLLHISGVHQAGNLVQNLADMSIICRRVQAYQMVAAQQISDEVVEQIRNRDITAILFYSARSAQIFNENMEKMGLLDEILEIAAFCLSKNIADGLSSPYLKQIYYVNQPDEAALIELMQQKLNFPT